MNEPHQKDGLSTADMAAATEKKTTDQDMKTRPVGTTATKPETMPKPAGTPTGDGAQKTGAKPAALLTPDESGKFRERWDTIQTTFVDQPRQAVEQADALVAEVMKRLAEVFADERSK